MSEAAKPDRYECRIVLEPDGKHVFIELAEDASGTYMRRQDLGFTRDTVKALREAIGHIDSEWGMDVPQDDGTTRRCLPEHMEAWNLPSLADHIEALLPPLPSVVITGAWFERNT